MTDNQAGAKPAGSPAANASRSRNVARVRSLTVGLAFFLTCLSLVLATTTWWIHDSVLDTDHFVAITAPLVDDPAVQEQLVTVTTTQLNEALDLGPIGSYVVTGISREVYASDAFASIWERAMRQVHGRIVAVLRGDAPIVQTDNGQIVLNAFPLYNVVAERVNGLNIDIAGRTIQVPTLTNPEDADASRAELCTALGRQLSPTFGTIPIADATKLETAQGYLRLFDALVIVLFVITILLGVLTIVLARRRITMVALLGLGVLVSLLAARLIVNSAANDLSTAISTGGPGAIIGGQIVLDLANSYRQFARGVLLLGLVAAVAATAAVWLIERRAGTTTASGVPSSVVDGWFLALAGLVVALVALLLLGLTVPTLVVVAVAWVVWLVAVLRWRRPASTPRSPSSRRHRRRPAPSSRPPSRRAPSPGAQQAHAAAGRRHGVGGVAAGVAVGEGP